MAMMSQFANMMPLSIFYASVFFLSSLVTVPSFLWISLLVLELWQIFYKGLTRNLEIRNTSVWVLPNIWRLGWIRDAKFGTNVPDKNLLHTENCQDCSCYCFWVIKIKPTGRKITPTSQINVNAYIFLHRILTAW